MSFTPEQETELRRIADSAIAERERKVRVAITLCRMDEELASLTLRKPMTEQRTRIFDSYFWTGRRS